MSAPENLTIEFTADTPESLRTIHMGGESQNKKSNEYNISVFNADGSSARGQVQGVVTMNAYAPGTDTPRTPETVSLASGKRKFDLFQATIERAIFSASGLAPGQKVRVQAIRGNGFTVGRAATNTLQPVNLRQWTPNYSGVGYVVIPAWQPAGDFEISFQTLRKDVFRVDTFLSGLLQLRDTTVLDTGGGFRFFSYIGVGLGAIAAVRVTADLNNVEASSIDNVLTLDVDGMTNSVTGGIHRNIEVIGGRSTVSQLDGQLYNLRLTDLDNPSNSRFYPSLIESVDMPDGLELVDELGPKDITNTVRPGGRGNGNEQITSYSEGVLSIERISGTGSIGVGFFSTRKTIIANVIESSGAGFRSQGQDVEAGQTFTMFTEGSNDATRLVFDLASTTVGDIGTLTLRFFEVTDGTLTNFPAAQPWVPVLGDGQAYNSGHTNGSGTFINGAGTGPFGPWITRFLDTSGIGASWSNKDDIFPVGSLIKNGLVVAQRRPTGMEGAVNALFATLNTDEEFQAAFEYPNVFDIDVFDSATEGYVGGFGGGNFTRGVQITPSIRLTSLAGSGVAGSFLNSIPTAIPVGSVLTANNGAQVRHRSFQTDDTMDCDRVSGTPEEIQTGFQWPNHFTVTPP